MHSSVLEGVHQIDLNSEKVTPNPEWHPWASGGPGGSRVSRKTHHVVNLQYTVKNKPVGLWSYHLPKRPGTGLCAKCFDSELGVLNLHDYIQTGYYSGFKIWSVFLKKTVKELPWKTEGLFIKGDFFALLSSFTRCTYIRNAKTPLEQAASLLLILGTQK